MTALSKSKYILDEYECLMKAPNLNISTIDKLSPVLAKKVIKLFLSNNYISSLKTISQFSNLC